MTESEMHNIADRHYRAWMSPECRIDTLSILRNAVREASERERELIANGFNNPQFIRKCGPEGAYDSE